MKPLTEILLTRFLQMNERIIIIESILRQERHLLAQSEIVKLETELQQLKESDNE